MGNKFNIKGNVTQLQNETKNSTQNINVGERFKKEPIFMTIFLGLLVNGIYDVVKFVISLFN